MGVNILKQRSKTMLFWLYFLAVYTFNTLFVCLMYSKHSDFFVILKYFASKTGLSNVGLILVGRNPYDVFVENLSEKYAFDAAPIIFFGNSLAALFWITVFFVLLSFCQIIRHYCFSKHPRFVNLICNITIAFSIVVPAYFFISMNSSVNIFDYEKRSYNASSVNSSIQDHLLGEAVLDESVFRHLDGGAVATALYRRYCSYGALSEPEIARLVAVSKELGERLSALGGEKLSRTEKDEFVRKICVVEPFFKTLKSPK